MDYIKKLGAILFTARGILLVAAAVATAAAAYLTEALKLIGLE